MSAQLEDDDEKSCSDHASEHQDRVDVDRDELRDLELHVARLVASADTGSMAPEHLKLRLQQQLRRSRIDDVDLQGPRAAAPGHRGLEDRTQKD